MEKNIEKVLLTEEQIQNKVNELKEQAEQAIKDAINSIKDKFPLWIRK